MKGNIFTRAKAKVKNYMTNKNLERFEKHRSKKLGKPYIPASKKNKGFKKYDSSYKRTESPFTNITDPGKLKKFKKELKPTRKRILSSTQTPSGMMTEYSKADDIGTAIVYRKGGKKYTKDLDLEFNPTGEYRQITRKDKRILKKEGSYVSGRKMKRIKDDYENYVVNHGDVFRDNIRIGNYLIYNKIEGFTPKHPNIFNQYKDIQLLFEKLIDLVIDTTINCKWKNRDWNINNVIVDKNNKFHLIDLDSVTDNYYYENVIASVNRWDINGVRVDNHLRNRLKILENV